MPSARVSTVRDSDFPTIGLAGGNNNREAAIGQQRLSAAWANTFLRLAIPYTARCRQVIHYEGRPTTAVYFVEHGRIKCTSTASDGRELLLCEFGAGEFFGLIEALNGARAVGTTTATETSSLKYVRIDLFRSLLADNSDLAPMFARILAEQLKIAYERSTDIAYESLEHRVLSTLRKLACSSDGCTVVQRSLSINELASMVAASRTRVSLAVQDLIRRGRLGRVGGRFVIPAAPESGPALRK